MAISVSSMNPTGWPVMFSTHRCIIATYRNSRETMGDQPYFTYATPTAMKGNSR
jgi:hypothetical protein